MQPKKLKEGTHAFESVFAYAVSAHVMHMNKLTGEVTEGAVVVANGGRAVRQMFIDHTRPNSGLWQIDEVKFVFFWEDNETVLKERTFHRVTILCSGIPEAVPKQSIRRVRLGIPTPIEAALNLPACPDCDAGRGDPCRTPGRRTRMPHAGRERVAQIDGIKLWWEKKRDAAPVVEAQLLCATCVRGHGSELRKPCGTTGCECWCSR